VFEFGSHVLLAITLSSYAIFNTLKNPRNVCRAVKPINCRCPPLIRRRNCDYITITQFFATNIILTISAIITNRELDRIVSVCPGIILESVGSCCCATPVKRQNLPIVRLYDSHRLICLGDTSCWNSWEFSVYFFCVWNIWSRNPVPFGFRRAHITIILFYLDYLLLRHLELDWRQLFLRLVYIPQV
jgi:hypothetical protein